jgi:hypothetical protein
MRSCLSITSINSNLTNRFRHAVRALRDNFVVYSFSQSAKPFSDSQETHPSPTVPFLAS